MNYEDFRVEILVVRMALFAFPMNNSMEYMNIPVISVGLFMIRMSRFVIPAGYGIDLR